MAKNGHSKFFSDNFPQKDWYKFLAILNLYQSFWEKLSEKIQNGHFWPFQIYTSLFGKNCQKNSECPFQICTSLFGKNCWKKFGMAILNLYQSFWEKLSEKIWNGHFWPFWIYNSLSGKNCQKKFETVIFGCYKFIPVFLGKIVRKILNGHFGNSEFILVFWGKIVRKNSEWPFLAIPNLYQSFWEKLSEKFRMPIPNLYQSFWDKLSEKIQNGHFWPFWIYTSLFGKNCQKKFGIFS